MDRATRGDTAAIGQLLKQLAPGVIRAARSLMGTTHADVDDVVQQSLIGLVQALPAFRGECSPSHFASRIVTRTALAARRRTAIRGERQDDAIEPDAFGVAPSQDEAIEAERRRHAVRSLMETLPEEQAETLALRVVLGFSLEEVAETTGVPLNTVRSRVRLAKASLKKRIEADPRLHAALEVE
ncbi:MAG: RNA polymerase sigma factor [Archangium sp.]|nr:RNA polymerase sigma factor [Archangium sp.]MDP3156647.1 RNA polymerase sigma factor [Archangium sp.]MDP3570588.1 RNA polymerase sigma factor [Archangium sp.]